MNNEHVVRHLFSRRVEQSLNPLCYAEAAFVGDSLSFVIPAHRSQPVEQCAEHHRLPLRGGGDKLSNEESNPTFPGTSDGRFCWRQNAVDALNKTEQGSMNTMGWAGSGDASMHHSEIVLQTDSIE
jgi:hypothetical protein